MFGRGDSMPVKQPIVILGSGIGGLTLGRCLRQRGIPSVTFERASSSPRHTYGITLNRWAYGPLLQVLSIDETTFRRRVAVDNLYHAGTGRVYAAELAASDSAEDATGAFRANRAKLERLLGEGQDIRWEHSLREAKASSEEAVTNLTFQNDLEISTLSVVDALGVHSQLRKTLLPHCGLTVLPFAVYSGKRHVRQDHFRKSYAPHLRDANILELRPDNQKDVLLQIWVNDHIPGGEVDISYVYSRPASSEQPDPLHNPNRPIPGATDIPEAFYDELQLLVIYSKLEEPFSSMFDPRQIRRERLLHWLMRTVLVDADDLSNLADSGVVMIGDSAHATPILGGDGANHAMQDAVKLAEVIAASSGSHAGLSLDRTAISGFYESCARRWREEVQESEKRIARMHFGKGAVL